MSEPQIDQQLDASGLRCPEPVMLLHNRVRGMAAGEVLEMVATDPSTERDVARFCQFLGHILLQMERLPDPQYGERWRYLIQKKERGYVA